MDVNLPQESLLDLTRRLRNALAEQPTRGDEAAMAAQSLGITIIDYAHHLDERLRFLEQRVKSLESKR